MPEADAMLMWILIVGSIVTWTAIVVVYFWREIHSYMDNRFGPQSKPPKHKPPRRRLYD